MTILISLTLLSANAQSALPPFVPGFGYTQWQPSPVYTPAFHNSKWQLRPSAGLSAGYIFLNGGISYVTAPLSLTLFRPLTPNVTAFAGITAAPTAFSFSSGYAAPPLNKHYSNGYGLGINAGIQGGLIYTNDAHTFSISGSFFMQRGSYPVYSSPRRVDDSKR
jgi:hypothetical protein